MADPFAVSSSTSAPFDGWSTNVDVDSPSSVDPFASSTVEDAFTASTENNQNTPSIDDAFASVKEFQSLSNAKSPATGARASSTLESPSLPTFSAASTSSSTLSFATGITPDLPFVPVVGPILPDSDEYVSRLEKKLLKLHSKPLEARQQPPRQVAGSEFFVTTSASSGGSSSSSFFPSARSSSNDRHFSSATSSWLDDDDDDNNTTTTEQKDSLDSKESTGGYHSSEDEYEPSDSAGGPARTVQWMEDQFALLDNFEQQLDEEHLAQMADDIRVNGERSKFSVNSLPFSKLEEEEPAETSAATVAATPSSEAASNQQPRVIEIESSDADLSGAPRHVQSLDQPNALCPPSSGHSVISASVPTPPTTYLGYLSHRHLYYQSQLYMAQASEWLETRECAIM